MFNRARNLASSAAAALMMAAASASGHMVSSLAGVSPVKPQQKHSKRSTAQIRAVSLGYRPVPTSKGSHKQQRRKGYKT